MRTLDGLYRLHCLADDIEVRRANMALMAAASDLLAELKRCYEEIDFLKANVLNDDELWWIATCNRW